MNKEELKKKIDDLVDSFDEALKEEGIEPPGEVARASAMEVLHRLVEEPSRICASPDEGIIFEFCRNSRYGDIECYEDGKILCSIFEYHSDGKPEIWDTTDYDLDASIRRVEEWVGS